MWTTVHTTLWEVEKTFLVSLMVVLAVYRLLFYFSYWFDISFSLPLSSLSPLRRNLKINATFPESVLTLWASVARQRGVECSIGSGSLNISYLSVLTPFQDGLTRRPSRSWNIVNFSGAVQDVTVYVNTVAGQSSAKVRTCTCIISLCTLLNNY